jgi:hypothetical protein
MKETTLEQLPQAAQSLINDAEHQRILVTRGGKPFAIIVGIEDEDEEDLHLEESAEFWKMIADRRGRPTISIEEYEQRLGR